MSQPLNGVRVLDLTRLMPGNYAAWVFASFGADVIKVEDPGPGDYMREFGAQVDGQGALNHLVNRGKRSVVIDLKSEEGRDALLRLVDTADVLIETFRPGVLDRLGVGYDVLKARRPSLVYASATGYGTRGPLANRAGHDLNFVAFSGLLDQLGSRGSAPIVPPVAVSDLVGGGFNAAIATLALLFQARATGIGGKVETSLAEAAALLPSNLLADILAGEPVPARGEAEYTGGSGAYNVYALADGYIVVGAVEAQFWRKMSEVLEEPGLIERRDDDSYIRECLTRRFAKLNRQEATSLFADDDTCVSVVQNYSECFESEHGRVNGYLQRVPGLSMPVLAAPYRIDGSRLAETVPAPRQGQHTTEVMSALGYSAEELEDLQRRGILAPRG